MPTDLKKYKKILNKYGYTYSDEQLLEVVSNIRNLAEVIVSFKQEKNKPNHHANRRRNYPKS